MKLHRILIAAAFLLPASAMADTIGLYVGAGQWDHGVSGGFRDNGTVNIESSALNMPDNREGYFYVNIEHPVPLIPNIRLASTDLIHNGSNGTVNATFGGATINASNVTSIFDFTHTDITLYYELLDNVVSFDVGITARQLDGQIYLSDGTNTGQVSLDEVVPMVYGKVAIDLPLTGLAIVGEGNFLSIGDADVTDLTVKVTYETDFLLGVEAGVRTFSLTLDNVDTITSDLEFDGPFVGLFLHF